MTKDEARSLLKEAIKHVDFINLGRTISALGEYEYDWTKFDNNKWRPNKNLALKEAVWLKDNADKILEALTVLKQTKG